MRTLRNALAGVAILALLVGSSGSVAAENPADDASAPQSILLVGNSLAFYNQGVESDLIGLIGSEDPPGTTEVEHFTLAGYTPKDHYRDSINEARYGAFDGIRSGKYDVIVLQDDIPEFKDGDLGQFMEYARLFDEEIDAVDARTVFFMAPRPWPSPGGVARGPWWRRRACSSGAFGGYLRKAEDRARDPDTRVRVLDARRDVEPVPVPEVGCFGELPAVDPDTETSDLEVGIATTNGIGIVHRTMVSTALWKSMVAGSIVASTSVACAMVVMTRQRTPGGSRLDRCDRPTTTTSLARSTRGERCSGLVGSGDLPLKVDPYGQRLARPLREPSLART